MDLVAGLSYVGIMVLVLYQVVARYIFNIGVPWIEEISRLLYVYIAFLGAAISMRDKQAIRIDMVPRLLPEKPRRLLHVGGEIMCFILLALLFRGCVKTFGIVWPTYLSTLDWVSNGWMYMAGIIGFGYMMLVQIANAVKWLLERGKGESA
jgi:TRAP-type C4-dicarboxylate transport system permease small subunit